MSCDERSPETDAQRGVQDTCKLLGQVQVPDIPCVRLHTVIRRQPYHRQDARDCLAGAVRRVHPPVSVPLRPECRRVRAYGPRVPRAQVRQEQLPRGDAVPASDIFQNDVPGNIPQGRAVLPCPAPRPRDTGTPRGRTNHGVLDRKHRPVLPRCPGHIHARPVSQLPRLGHIHQERARFLGVHRGDRHGVRVTGLLRGSQPGNVAPFNSIPDECSAVPHRFGDGHDRPGLGGRSCLSVHSRLVHSSPGPDKRCLADLREPTAEISGLCCPRNWST